MSRTELHGSTSARPWMIMTFDKLNRLLDAAREEGWQKAMARSAEMEAETAHDAEIAAIRAGRP